MIMRKLTTIQKREKLNNIYAVDENGNGGANRIYEIRPVDDNPNIMGEHHILATIEFQNGARKLPNSIAGVIDTDLLEIVRDRLKSFQCGEFSSRENACALTHIEEALMWLDRRIEDRIERNDNISLGIPVSLYFENTLKNNCCCENKCGESKEEK